MPTLGLPALVALAGALVYGFGGNAKAQELGRICFFVGTLWAVYVLSAGALHIRI